MKFMENCEDKFFSGKSFLKVYVMFAISEEIYGKLN